MLDTKTFNLAIYNPIGDFEQCFVAGDIRTSVTIDRFIASQILNQLHGLVLGGGDESISSASGSFKEGVLWPYKDIEEATGIILDSVMFDNTGAKDIDEPKLVVTKTGFFWRITTQALGILETERIDILAIRLAFELPTPVDLPGLQSSSGEWLLNTISQGSADTEQEVLVLNHMVREMANLMIPSQLETVVNGVLALAGEEGEYAELEMFNQPNPSKATQELISTTLDEGHALHRKLSGTFH